MRLNCRPSGLATLADHTGRSRSARSSGSKTVPCRTWSSAVAIARSAVPVPSLVDDDELGAALAAAVWLGWLTGPLSGFRRGPNR